MEKLYKKLEQYSKDNYYPFHMPGHKRNAMAIEGEFPIERDITEIEGFDNLHHAEGVILQAQIEAAKLYGVKETFFSINGSTAALLSAISASVSKGGNIMIARNCHKAVYHGLYLRDLEPTYVFPHIDIKLGINGGISPRRVERYLEENPNIEAVLITSPTYDGVVSDVQQIAEAAHKHGAVLIVDEAHGAHLKFSGYFPVSATELGADLVIQSIHKTLPSMTQTALLHRCSDRVDRDKVKRFMGIYQSSSPSYILMASIDACIHKIETEGKEMFAKYIENLDKARERLSKCKYIQLITPQKSDIERIFDVDRSKMIFSTVNSSLTGHDLHEILNKEFHIELEMAAENYALALTSVGDTEEGFERLCLAIEELDKREAGKEYVAKRIPEDNIYYTEKKQMLRIADAMERPVVRCPIDESVGKIAAEFAYLYPPGIPMLVPGEQITGLFVRNVRRYMEQGLSMQGLSDESNKTICVIKE